jgi:hypothetical protein
MVGIFVGIGAATGLVVVNVFERWRHDVSESRHFMGVWDLVWWWLSLMFSIACIAGMAFLLNRYRS